jgi:hypothetical protein
MRKTMVIASAALATVAVITGSGVAVAQTPAAPAAQPSTMTNVENWTAKQWNDAERTWTTDKVKWADCQQQSKKQKLTGGKSWSFLYNCMT